MRIQLRHFRMPIFALLLTLAAANALAQKNLLKGTVVDTAERKNLHFAIVALIDLSDTTLYRSVRSDAEGNFQVEKIPAGKYTLMICYPKMADFLQDITLTDTSKLDLKKIPMTPQSVLLQEVIVSSGRPIRMRGDTLEYTADSFATRANANVEELLKRLPGIYVERNGAIYAQGKKVEKILVDGDEFFSEDPGLASQFLRADAIDKVQVYDQRSEQAEFTGIDDGVRTKTINLKLKENKKKGIFGTATARTNTDDFHRYEAMLAYFDGPRKTSVFGLASRVGKYYSDFNGLGNYVEQDYEQIMDGAQNMFSVSYEDFDDLVAGPVPTVLDAGAHYSDKWNESRQKAFFNYRVRDSKASMWNRNFSLQVLPGGSSFATKQNTTQVNSQFGQKASASFTTEVDSFSSVKVSVNGKKGHGSSYSTSGSSSANENGVTVNENMAGEKEMGESYEFSSNITYRRSFRKQGRSLVVSIQQEKERFEKDNQNHSMTRYYDPETGVFNRLDSLNQLQQTDNTSHAYAGKAIFTETIAGKVILSAEYGWRRSAASSFFGTYNNKQNLPLEKVDSLSNDYDFTTTTHIAAANLGWNRPKFNLTVGGRFFITRFRQDDNDRDFSMKRNFINWSPSINGSVHLLSNSYLSINYAGNTSQPSVNQLQPISRTNDNLYVNVGNPDLKPSFSHHGSLAYSRFNMKRRRSWNASVGISYIQNRIVSRSYIDLQGRTVSQYINLNGLPSFSGQAGTAIQNKDNSFRANAYLSVFYSQDYRLQNDQRIRSRNIGSGLRTSVNYEWKDVLEVSYTGSLNANFSKATVGDKTNTVISHTHIVGNSFFLPWDFSVTSSCNLMFQPANRSFGNNLNYVTCNASVDKTVFKNKSLKFKFEVNDIFNQNRGYMRYANGANIYESETYVVKRFWLLSAVWSFSKNL